MKHFALERLYDRIGQPAWFYPAVMFILFIVLPCVASAVDGVMQ